MKSNFQISRCTLEPTVYNPPDCVIFLNLVPQLYTARLVWRLNFTYFKNSLLVFQHLCFLVVIVVMCFFVCFIHSTVFNQYCNTLGAVQL